MTEFKPIANPFIVGNPIKSREMFFGRQDDFEYIKRKLQSGIKSYIIVFCGERRSGKTSILFQVLNGELGENFLPIMIDMQTMAGLQSENEFFEKIAKEIYKSLDESKINTQQYDFFLDETSPYKVFERLLDDIHTAYPDKNILFLIDEYELIESKIVEGSLNKNFVPFLAGVLESERKISFLFTGSKKLDDRKAPYWNILFAKSMYRNVSFLSRNDTLRLVTEPVKNTVTYDKKVLDQIYRLTAGQPFYTQVVCQNIVDHLNDHQKNHVEIEDLNQIVQEILENPLPQMIYFWNSLSNEKKLILSFLSEILEDSSSFIQASEMHKFSRKREFGINLSLKTISTTLETLYHQQLLKKTESGYNFYMDLFRGWVKQDHSFWQVMKEISTDISGINVEDSVSIASTTYETEKSFFDKEGQSKRKVLIPVISGTVIIIALAGYFLFLKPSLENHSNSLENASPPSSEKTLAKNEVSKKDLGSDQTKPGITEENTIKEENEDSQNNDKAKPKTENKESILRSKALQSRKSMEDAKNAALQAGATNTNQYQQALSRESEAEKNFKAGNYETASSLFALAAGDFASSKSTVISNQRREASNLLQEVSEAAERARKNSAPQLAADTYSRAEDRDKQGRDLYNRGRYNDAQSALREANQLYAEATSEASRATNKYAAEIQGVRNAIADFKKQPQNTFSYLSEYQQATAAEKEGNDYLQNGDQAKALESFQQAQRLYKAAQAKHADRVKQIRDAIQKYARALENKDIRQLRSLYRNFTPDLEQKWSTAFKSFDKIEAEMTTQNINFLQDRALALVDVHLKYRGFTNSDNRFKWEIEFTPVNENLLIENINETH